MLQESSIHSSEPDPPLTMHQCHKPERTITEHIHNLSYCDKHNYQSNIHPIGPQSYGLQRSGDTG